MAGPFDISTYEQLGGGKTPIDPKVLEAANRARRIALYGPEAVTRMEGAGGVFRGGVPPRVQPANGPRFSAAEMNSARTQGAMPPAPGMAPTSPAAAMTRMGKIRSLLGKGGTAGLALGAGMTAIDNFDTLLPMLDRRGQDANQIGGMLNDSSTPLPSWDEVTGIRDNPIPRELSAIEQVNAMFPPRRTPGVVAPVSPAARAESPGFGVVPQTSGWVTDPREKAVANSVIESAAIPPSGTGYIRGNKSGRTYRFNNASETPERAREGAAAREREMFANMPSTGFASIDAAMRATAAQIPSLRASGARKNARADIVAQTALAKAMKDLNNPSKVDIAEPALGSNNPGLVTVVSADGTTVTHPKGAKPIPTGYTRESILAEAAAKRAQLVGKKKNTKGVEAQLARLDEMLEEYRLKLPPLK